MREAEITSSSFLVWPNPTGYYLDSVWKTAWVVYNFSLGASSQYGGDSQPENILLDVFLESTSEDTLRGK